VENADLVFKHKNRYKGFLELLESNSFAEIICLPDIEAVKNADVKLSMSEVLGGGAINYTPSEFVAHLKQILALLNSCENYYVYVMEKSLIEHYSIYVREELGVIITKTSQPPVVLAMSEGNMVGAFWDFLKNLIGEKAYGARNREEVIEKLHNYLGRLTDE
jgi:hypothetical protein